MNLEKETLEEDWCVYEKRQTFSESSDSENLDIHPTSSESSESDSIEIISEDETGNYLIYSSKRNQLNRKISVASSNSSIILQNDVPEENTYADQELPDGIIEQGTEAKEVRRREKKIKTPRPKSSAGTEAISYSVSSNVQAPICTMDLENNKPAVEDEKVDKELGSNTSLEATLNDMNPIDKDDTSKCVTDKKDIVEEVILESNQTPDELNEDSNEIKSDKPRTISDFINRVIDKMKAESDLNNAQSSVNYVDEPETPCEVNANNSNELLDQGPSGINEGEYIQDNVVTSSSNRKNKNENKQSSKYRKFQNEMKNVWNNERLTKKEDIDKKKDNTKKNDKGKSKRKKNKESNQQPEDIAENMGEVQHGTSFDNIAEEVDSNEERTQLLRNEEETVTYSFGFHRTFRIELRSIDVVLILTVLTFAALVSSSLFASMILFGQKQNSAIKQTLFHDEQGYMKQPRYTTEDINVQRDAAPPPTRVLEKTADEQAKVSSNDITLEYKEYADLLSEVKQNMVENARLDFEIAMKDKAENRLYHYHVGYDNIGYRERPIVVLPACMVSVIENTFQFIQEQPPSLHEVEQTYSRYVKKQQPGQNKNPSINKHSPHENPEPKELCFDINTFLKNMRTLSFRSVLKFLLYFAQNDNDLDYVDIYNNYIVFRTMYLDEKYSRKAAADEHAYYYVKPLRYCLHQQIYGIIKYKYLYTNLQYTLPHQLVSAFLHINNLYVSEDKCLTAVINHYHRGKIINLYHNVLEELLKNSIYTALTLDTFLLHDYYLELLLSDSSNKSLLMFKLFKYNILALQRFRFENNDFNNTQKMGVNYKKLKERLSSADYKELDKYNFYYDASDDENVKRDIAIKPENLDAYFMNQMNRLTNNNYYKIKRFTNDISGDLKHAICYPYLQNNAVDKAYEKDAPKLVKFIIRLCNLNYNLNTQESDASEDIANDQNERKRHYRYQHIDLASARSDSSDAHATLDFNNNAEDIVIDLGKEAFNNETRKSYSQERVVYIDNNVSEAVHRRVYINDEHLKNKNEAEKEHSHSESKTNQAKAVEKEFHSLLNDDRMHVEEPDTETVNSNETKFDSMEYIGIEKSFENTKFQHPSKELKKNKKDRQRWQHQSYSDINKNNVNEMNAKYDHKINYYRSDKGKHSHEKMKYQSEREKESWLHKRSKLRAKLRKTQNYPQQTDEDNLHETFY